MRRSLWLACSFLLATAAWAEWALPTDWPVARLVRNLERALERRPDDGTTLYALGRLHAYAFTFASDSVAVFRDAPPADESSDAIEVQPEELDHEIANDAVQRSVHARAAEKSGPHAMPAAERLAHLEAAVRDLARARELLAERAEVSLSLATVLEAGAPFAAQVDSPALFGWKAELADEDRHALEGHVAELGSRNAVLAAAAERMLGEPATLERSLPLLWDARTSKNEAQRKAVAKLLARAWLTRAVESYRRAFEVAEEADGALETKPLANAWSVDPLEQLVSYEAGQACVRLSRGDGFPTLDEGLVARVQKHLAALERKPPNLAITPIVLALDDCRALDELVDPNSSVPFDLDGDGVMEPWPWLAPGAGWLVWDPEHTGEITSGRQLFGDRSGWFFFRDGYRVLDGLDDDRDGELKGAELAGIAVWFDRDADGVSDRGEVVPVEALGIVALATNATERIGASLGNAGGVELADGRLLPTYDWVLERQQP